LQQEALARPSVAVFHLSRCKSMCSEVLKEMRPKELGKIG
jgi:hypothetical protein